MIPAVLGTPFGKWELQLLLFNGYLLRLISAVIFGIAGKIIWE